MTYTIAGVAVAFVIMFAVKSVARTPPRTMNKEWEEQTNEYLKVGGFSWNTDTEYVTHRI